MTTDEITTKITKLVEGLPEWLRYDLISRDSIVRSRAEETLSAMIAAALIGVEKDEGHIRQAPACLR